MFTEGTFLLYKEQVATKLSLLADVFHNRREVVHTLGYKKTQVMLQFCLRCKLLENIGESIIPLQEVAPPLRKFSLSP